MANNEVDYRVTGGGHYTHHVWNYSHDSVLVSKTFFGIPYAVATYAVERRNTMLDHDIVLLAPIKRWFGFSAILVAYLLTGPPLERLQPVTGEFMRLKIIAKNKTLTSTGKVGKYACATISSVDDDTLAAMARLSKHDLTVAQCQKFTDGELVPATTLCEYHRGEQDIKTPVVCPVSESVQRYQYNPPHFHPEAKPMLTPFMSPLLNECYAPDICIENERAAIKGRVEIPRDRPTPEVSTFMSKCMDEFLEFLINKPHALHPVLIEEVQDRQDRPSQRQIIEKSMGTSHKAVTETFLKKEAYGKVTHPRIICQIGGVDKVEFSTFTYALAEVLERHDWYAFGKLPSEVSESVANVCYSATTSIANTDYNRFDGTKGKPSQELDRRMYLRAFHPRHHNAILECLRKNKNLKGYTTFGLSFDTLDMQLSGSPDTAISNTVSNVFTDYFSKRLDIGGAKTPLDAWMSLGMYGGDDGLVRDPNRAAMESAAYQMHFSLDIEIVKRGECGVTFLSRQFGPQVWMGDSNSCCDIPRALSKLHTTVALPANVTPEMKLLEKCRALLLTDYHTPVIGKYAQRVQMLYNADLVMKDETAPMRGWQSHITDAAKQYRNEEASWMDEYLHRVLPDADLVKFTTWLYQANTLADLMKAPLLREPPPPKIQEPVVLNGEVQQPEKVDWGVNKAQKPSHQKMTPEEFEVWKQKKKDAGTWKERQVKTPKAAHDGSAASSKDSSSSTAAPGK